MDNIKVKDNWLENAQLICTKTDGIIKYDFTKIIYFPYNLLSEFIIMIICYRE